MKQKSKKIKSRRYRRLTELVKVSLVVILIGLVVRLFVLFPYRVDNTDMEDALYPGDFLLASQLSYKFGEPKVGDVVVFEHPFKVDEHSVGRVLAIEGQTVEIIGKTVYVDDEKIIDIGNVKYTDPDIIPEIYSKRDYADPVTVPSGSVFILDDNRDQAEDSRNFGLVHIDDLIGKGLFVYWSWKPDPDSPAWESPYIIPAISILFYNLLHFPSRIGWDRLGSGTN